MAEFAVRVVQIDQPVEDHPDADRLSIIKIGGYLCISAKVENEDGSLRHRYSVGDLVVYVPEGAVVPEYILREGFWSEKDNKGILAGSKGDRVKAKRLRGIFSQGLLLGVEMDEKSSVGGPNRGAIIGKDGKYVLVREGVDVAEDLGITKYEPPIPVAMAGEVASIFGYTSGYDFESIQSVTDLFTVGEDVVATEKLHGTNCQIGYVPGLNHEELFFGGDIYVGSKGLSAKGLVMKNNEANAGNLYVRTLNALLDAGLGEKIKALSETIEGNPAIRIFGEVYGKGVQDLAYGLNAPAFAVFDIKIGDEFVAYDDRIKIAAELGLAVVPTLYEGPYDLDALIVHRDGKDTLSGTNVREGIVIVARDGGRNPMHGRKIGKWVSPAYLERKGGTEFN